MTMTEQDYLDITNLAKLRLALLAVRDCSPARPIEHELERQIRRGLAEWISSLEDLTQQKIAK